MKRYAEYALVIIAAVIVTAFALAAYVWSGFYDVGADDPHWPLTLNVLQTVRDHSIRRRSEGLRVPDLNAPELILKGAGQYAAMCAPCHLQPGIETSETREGMYPRPPNLAKTRVTPQVAFWVIKHGIKMSAMPAWGGSHDDRTIWSIVAFLQKLPNLTPQQYKTIVAKAPPDRDMEMHSKARASE